MNDVVVDGAPVDDWLAQPFGDRLFCDSVQSSPILVVCPVVPPSVREILDHVCGLKKRVIFCQEFHRLINKAPPGGLEKTVGFYKSALEKYEGIAAKFENG